MLHYVDFHATRPEQHSGYQWRTRFVVGNKVWCLKDVGLGAWQVDKELTVKEVVIQSYWGSNFCVVRYATEDAKGQVRSFSEGAKDASGQKEFLPQIFGNRIDAQSECIRRMREHDARVADGV